MSQKLKKMFKTKTPNDTKKNKKYKNTKFNKKII